MTIATQAIMSKRYQLKVFAAAFFTMSALMVVAGAMKWHAHDIRAASMSCVVAVGYALVATGSLYVRRRFQPLPRTLA